MNISSHAAMALNKTWCMLKWTYGLLFVVAGADKFCNMVTMWSKYVGPMVLEYIPLDLAKLMMAVGVIEILIGLIILLHCTRIGGWLAAIWLVIIAANLVSMGTYFDIAIRDMVMAVGALALSCLTKVKHGITE